MADTKIEDLTANTSPVSTDILPMVDDPAGTPATQKITYANMFKVVNDFTEDTTPDLSADYVNSYDTSASAAKKVLMSQFRMAHANNTLTTSNLTATLNTHHHLTIAGLTANRNFILPAPTAVGQMIGVSIADGDDAYFVIIIGDTSIKINEGSAATEFHRLQTKGKTLTFRATSTTNWECVAGLQEIELELRNYDGLMPFATSGSAKVISHLSKYPFQLKAVSVSYTVLTTNNGTNYWTYTISDVTGNFGSVNTSAASASTNYRVDLSPSKTNFVVSDQYILLTGTFGAGTPGSTYLFGKLTVWLS